jgi:hypothetical protein
MNNRKDEDAKAIIRNTAIAYFSFLFIFVFSPFKIGQESRND